MSKIISLLEKIGQEPELKTIVDLQRVTEFNSLEPDVQAAILSGSVQQIMEVLQARANVICGIFPAEEPDERPEKQPDEQPEEAPQDDDSEQKALAS